MDDDDWERLYGPWQPFDPAGVQQFLAGFEGPWWVVGGWAIELFSGTGRRHEDIDVGIFRRDLPKLLELVAGRYHVWSVGDGMLRPVNDDWPEPHPRAGQVWLREHSRAPWVMDCLLNDDRDGQWVSRREDWAAPLEDVTWLTDEGIRVQEPQVVLQHKARQDQPKDRADRDAAWPLLDDARRAWLREAVLRVYGAEHPWLAWMDEQPVAT